ncbi:MAG: hypothetical protein FWD53_13125, partial [Phycisphaerales bacterium]|nr:hypothetical protein [Phycisphaerales bacterium]
ASALEHLTHATKLAPDSMECLQALTRVKVKLEQFDKNTITNLHRIASQGTDERWRTWAKALLIKYGFSEETSSNAAHETSNHSNATENDN